MDSNIKRFYDVPPLKIRENIVRLHWLNPGETRINGSNSFLLGTGKQRILIDCGADPLNSSSANYINSVITYLKDCGATISIVLWTHFHYDHIGAIPELLDAMSSEYGVDTAQHVTVSKRRIHHWYEDSIFAQIEYKWTVTDMTDSQVFEVDGARVTSMFTPGHSDDHMCFVLDDTFAGDEPEPVIFTGGSDLPCHEC